jgi:hypothetical protein
MTVMALHSGAIMVMSSHGKGRSAAIVGSVTEDILQRTFGPVVRFEPHAKSSDFTGPIIVNVAEPTTTASSSHFDALTQCRRKTGGLL